MMQNINKITLLMLLSFLTALYAGCGEAEIASKWRDHSIQIDGIHADWQTKGTEIKGADAFLAIYNDQKYIYLSLTSSNEALFQKMLMTGFTVWFDPLTNLNDILGIRFPLVAELPDKMPPMEPEGEFNPGKAQEQLLGKLQEFQILNHDKKVLESLLITDSKGIKLKLGKEGNSFVYELQMPFTQSASSPLELFTDTAKTIRVGLETGRPGAGFMGGPMGGPGMPMDGMGPPPDGDGPPMGGMPGGRGPGTDRTSSLNVWYKVRLSSAK